MPQPPVDGPAVGRPARPDGAATVGPARPDELPGLDRVRAALLQPSTLRRAVASGARRGSTGRWRRAELRLVEIAAGTSLQVTTYDDTQAHTSNMPLNDVTALIEKLLDQPFASWHVESTEPAGVRTLRWRVTRKGRVESSSSLHAGPVPAVDAAHDRSKRRLLDPADPVLGALGISDERGRVKPTRQAKLRQVEEFLRLLDTTLADAFSAGVLEHPGQTRPLRLVDLGCGNAYLTFTAFAHLRHRWPVRMVGVDVKEQARQRNSALTERLGWSDDLRFVRAGIADADVERPDVVLALHACDTATDDALSRALTWQAPVVLAAPCCHHHVHEQLRHRPAPEPYGLLTRDGILRERLADTLTDAMRAALVREQGYRVDVVEFVGSEHTPRNTLLRAVRTGASAVQATRQYAELVQQWGVTPALAALPREPASGSR
jgi:SAM-dependent methyltransferase